MVRKQSIAISLWYTSESRCWECIRDRHHHHTNVQERYLLMVGENSHGFFQYMALLTLTADVKGSFQWDLHRNYCKFILFADTDFKKENYSYLSVDFFSQHTKKDLDGFKKLFHRFLQEKGPSVDWGKIQRPPEDSVSYNLGCFLTAFLVHLQGSLEMGYFRSS